MNLAVFLTAGDRFSRFVPQGMADGLRSWFAPLRETFDRIDVVSWGTQDEERAAFPWSDWGDVLANSTGRSNKLYLWEIPRVHRGALERADVFFAMQHLGAPAALWAGRRLDKPVCVHCGFDWVGNSERGGAGWATRAASRFVDRWILDDADLLILTSRKHLDRVAPLHPRARVEYLPNGVDLATFRLRPEIAKIPHSVVSIGRLSPEKNFGSVIAALAGTGATYDIYGSGPLEPNLRDLAAHHGVRLHLRGAIPQSQIADVLPRYQVFVHSSLYEGSPKTPLEAMACGVSSVITRVAGNEEVLVEGENGLGAGTDPVSLRAAITRLLDDATLRVRIGIGGRRWVENGRDLVARQRRMASLTAGLARND